MDNNSKKMEFLVIGAGLPRTGTLSLMYALEIILTGKCHHMIKAIGFDEQWGDIFSGRMNDEDFKNFFLSNNEVAGVDVPFCFVYKRAMQVFPDAKVILTMRDPESWVKSMKSTIFRRHIFDPTMIFLFLGLFPTYLGDPRGMQKKRPKLMFQAAEKYVSEHVELRKAVLGNTGVEFFNKWEQNVEKTVPRERLLKYSVKEGWGPLCKFLNVPQPDIPFPKVNSSDEFTQARDTVYRRAWLLLYEFVSIPLWIYSVYRLPH